eukprot:s447_g12.t1
MGKPLFRLGFLIAVRAKKKESEVDFPALLEKAGGTTSERVSDLGLRSSRSSSFGTVENSTAQIFDAQ